MRKNASSVYIKKALKDEAEAIASLEVARAARVEIGRKLQELVIDKVKTRDEHFQFFWKTNFSGKPKK